MPECSYCSSTSALVREKVYVRNKKTIPDLKFPICTKCFCDAKTKGTFTLGTTTQNVTRNQMARIHEIIEAGQFDCHSKTITSFLDRAFDESERLTERIKQSLDLVELMHQRLLVVKKWHLDAQQLWGYALWSRYERRREEANGAISKPALRAMIFARDKFKCVNCPSTQSLSIDHIIAVKNGGTDDPQNLQTLCKKCNSSKGAK